MNRVEREQLQVRANRWQIWGGIAAVVAILVAIFIAWYQSSPIKNNVNIGGSNSGDIRQDSPSVPQPTQPTQPKDAPQNNVDIKGNNSGAIFQNSPVTVVSNNRDFVGPSKDVDSAVMKNLAELKSAGLPPVRIVCIHDSNELNMVADQMTHWIIKSGLGHTKTGTLMTPDKFRVIQFPTGMRENAIKLIQAFNPYFEGKVGIQLDERPDAKDIEITIWGMPRFTAQGTLGSF